MTSSTGSRNTEGELPDGVDLQDLDVESPKPGNDVRWSIDTFLRVKPNLVPTPSIDFTVKNVVIKADEQRSVLELSIPMDCDPGILHNNSAAGNLRFEFNRVLDENTSQEVVFDCVAKNRVDGVLEGINSTIFAYGQTGSGKTYSIFGGDTFQERGIIPRAIALLFEKITKRKNQDPTFEFKCKITFTEVYQETIYDLLALNLESAEGATLPVVQLMEGDDGIMLRNVNVFEVSSQDAALKLFFFGNNNRLTASTEMNIASSRSHAVFTILVETEGLVDEKTVYTSGKLNLVDLAGSERMYKMQNTKEQLKEAKAINLSLHFLEQVIVSLRDNMKGGNSSSPASAAPKSQQVSRKNSESALLVNKQAQHPSSHSLLKEKDKDKSNVDATSAKSAKTGAPPNGYIKDSNKDKDKDKEAFVPYRNSVLTSMLRDSLGGNCRSSFLLTISKEKMHFEESVATCRFGQRCGEVKVTVKANTEIGLSDQLRDLQQRLKMYEKRFVIVEERRRVLEEEFENECELRRKETELRTLSDNEKAQCKACVQELLAAARESLANTSSLGHLEMDDDALSDEQREEQRERERLASEELIERSQDALYNIVEEMDKALLVELSTALGGLVQSMYIERELSKREEAVREQRRLKQQQEQQAREDRIGKIQQLFAAEAHKTQIGNAHLNQSNYNMNGTNSVVVSGTGSPGAGSGPINNIVSSSIGVTPAHSSGGTPSALISSGITNLGTTSDVEELLWPLPENIANMLRCGRFFFKHNRFGSPKLRHYSVSSDWLLWQWTDVQQGQVSPPEVESLPLSSFEKVEIVREKVLMLRLISKPGGKTLSLEFVGGSNSSFDFETECRMWVGTLSLLINRSQR